VIFLILLLFCADASAENVSTELAMHFHQKYSAQSANLSHFIQDFDRVAGVCFKDKTCTSELMLSHDSVREQIEFGNRQQAVDAAILFASEVIKYDSKDQ